MKSHGTTDAMEGTLTDSWAQKSKTTIFSPSWNIHVRAFASFPALDVLAKIPQVLTSEFTHLEIISIGCLSKASSSNAKQVWENQALPN